MIKMLSKIDVKIGIEKVASEDVRVRKFVPAWWPGGGKGGGLPLPGGRRFGRKEGNKKGRKKEMKKGKFEYLNI